MATNDEDPATIKARRLQREREQEERAEERRAVVRGHMERRGLSQKELCDMAGLKTASALGNFLAGRARSLNMETLEPLAKALGLSVSQFIGDTAPAVPSTVQDSNDKEVIVERDGLRVTIKTNDPERLIRSLFDIDDLPPPKKKRA